MAFFIYIMDGHDCSSKACCKSLQKKENDATYITVHFTSGGVQQLYIKTFQL